MVRRARIWFEGHAFERWVRFDLQIDAAGDQAETEVEFLNIVDDFDSSNGLAALRNAYIDVGRWSEFRLRVGQFKVPYSRQALAQSRTLLFVDRAVTDRVFAPGRDIGLMIHGSLLGKDADLLDYAFGAFNGEGANRTNDDKGLLWSGRVAWNPFGDPGKVEGDWRRRKPFRASIAVNAWLHQDDQHADEGDDWALGVDFAARWRGLSITAELHRLRESRSSADDPSALGWFVQAAYAVIDRKLEIGLRTAHIDWDDNGNRDSARREHLLVANWYFDDHDFKIQSDFGWVAFHEGDHDDNQDGWRWRVQLQLTF
jgi:phosphate-selective porin